MHAVFKFRMWYNSKNIVNMIKFSLHAAFLMMFYNSFQIGIQILQKDLMEKY